jgi:hypothetical protein
LWEKEELKQQKTVSLLKQRGIAARSVRWRSRVSGGGLEKTSTCVLVAAMNK